MLFTKHDYARISITSSTCGPVPMSVTGTPSFSSISFMNDFALSYKSSIAFTPAHFGNRTSNFVIEI